ncbi:hybrid sensor histidine kinase/response regulator [Marinicauda salina]|uniref:histidine kinase n=1 Tax=Marinicauda salina TaxID=2135793 RepID=A0A2U2BU79_9PROT|nr:ATP-binding protein [Marinicauda salina]PWE17537.1 hybrid sensor histidine kinase/response regulator [Marinicauda salina]
MTDAPAAETETSRKADAPESDERAEAAPEPRSRWTRPLARAVFWAAALGAFGAAAVALFAAASAGWHGFVLLSGIACVAFLLLYALAAGETAGRSLAAGSSSETGVKGLAAAAFEALRDPVLVTDAGGRPRWANAAYRALAGDGGRGGPVGPERIWTGAAGGAVYRLARAAAAGQTGRETLPAWRSADGATVYAAEVSPLEGGGAVWRFFEERAEPDTEIETPDWAERAPVGLFLADGEGRVLATNATLREWLGVEAERPLKVKDFLAGDFGKAFAKTRGADGVSRLDARLLAREGVESPVVLAVEWDEERPPRARCVVYGLSTTGAPPGVAQAIADASPKAGRTLDDMFASAPFGVCRLDGADPETAILEDANPALVQLSGGGAIPGKPFTELFDWSEGESAEEVFSRALSGRGEPSEARMRAGDDAVREVHLFFAPARGGKRAAYIVDISALKELERQFAQAAKMQAVGQLAGGVAHDFNNMLTAIRLNTDELLGRHPVGDPSYAELQQINSTVARAAGLVKKLLAFSRKQTFRMTTLDLSDTLSDFSVLLRQVLEESVRLEIKHGRNLPLIRADKTQLENAVMNLATNARDAMREDGGGALTITTEAVDADEVRRAGAPDPKEGRWAAIRVSDTGSGMDEATLAKIFEPFFTTKEAGQGTGLGLATVYGIVKQSGGFLFAKSKPGEGTTFTIYLPEHAPSREEAEAIEADKAAREKPSKPADLAGKGRILLVEDEDAVRSIAAKTLIKRGYEVVEACDGEEALEILTEEPESFDLIISDVVMPGLDGPGLLEKGRDKLGDARVVFISGYAQEQFSDTLSKELDVSFLPKPFTLPQLAERVKEELGG